MRRGHERPVTAERNRHDGIAADPLLHHAQRLFEALPIQPPKAAVLATSDDPLVFGAKCHSPDRRVQIELAIEPLALRVPHHDGLVIAGGCERDFVNTAYRAEGRLLHKGLVLTEAFAEIVFRFPEVYGPPLRRRDPCPIGTDGYRADFIVVGFLGGLALAADVPDLDYLAAGRCQPCAVLAMKG